MTARATTRQADVCRGIRGAIQALRREGLSPADFRIVHRDGETQVLPIGADRSSDDAADMERRMKDAFGA